MILLLLALANPCVHPTYTSIGPRCLVEAARAQVSATRIYDPSYVYIRYPGGDVPWDRGACTDVIVRAYRAIGVDLQVKIHDYRKARGLSLDPNVDHRRVGNLREFFVAQGASLPITNNPADYLPGDVVTWEVSHIGIVTARGLVVHNKQVGTREQPVLFAWKITGHYRWVP